MSTRALLLAFGMLTATTFFGLSVYSEEAMNGVISSDGYGISTPRN